VLAAALLGLAAGCAAHVDLPPLPPSHPASPDAAAAPYARPSGVLDRGAPAPPAGEPAPAMEGHEHPAEEDGGAEAEPAPQDHEHDDPYGGRR
jgi:hypothetical protein